MRLLSLIGMKFGRLTVIAKNEKVHPSGALWDCVCDCGKNVVVNSLKLRSGKTKSCGCYRDQKISSLGLRHGLANKTTTYRTWKEMRQRCLNPNSDKWEWYGGRGIKICKRWDSFENFLEDMDERPDGMTLDRINNDGDYEPRNCQWATQLDQTRKQQKNKLSLELAAALRADAAAGMTYRELGKKYSVSPTTAHRCATGETWA